MTRGVRRLLALGAAATVALALGACGSSDDGGSGGDGGGTLRVAAPVLGPKGPDNPLNVLARRFESANPGTKVRVTMTSYEQYDPTLRVQISGGQPPDVIQNAIGYGSSTSTLPLARANALADLSDSPWARTLPESLRETLGFDGRVFTLPGVYTIIGAVYNRTAMEADGVRLPTSYDELLTLCRDVRASGKTLIALGGLVDYNIQNLIFTQVAATMSDEPDFAQRRLDGEVTFSESPGWLQALEQLKEMDETGCFGDDPAAVSVDAADQRLATGKSYMGIGLIDRVPAMEALNPRARFGLAPMPGGSADQTRVPGGAVLGFSVPARAKQVELAKRFVDFAAEPENAGPLPAVTGDGGPPQLPPYASQVQPLLEEERVVPFPDSLWPSPEVSAAMRTGMQGMLSGQGDPRAILKSMDSAWSSD
ncbi:ABC transporter substrate-binding protein [Conexibacter arvalis]|uniref:Raffinose/stachyose/melibiose transport system substrate-binding protein n=1 Tax=Conexibacter arvalis TaxID=912552 RepID=A0A840I8B9_9ACTN|nr:extracellular solute-binding protein [Conexibacter arvalis]MBB4660521.1 raffinose/stachyose/melibiose transport system substrate-binding protein [Conexibacter arvalis]